MGSLLYVISLAVDRLLITQPWLSMNLVTYQSTRTSPPAHLTVTSFELVRLFDHGVMPWKFRNDIGGIAGNLFWRGIKVIREVYNFNTHLGTTWIPFWRHCYSMKSLLGLILGGYICRYTPVVIRPWMISLTVPELSCWQTNRQTDRQTHKHTQTDSSDN